MHHATESDRSIKIGVASALSAFLIWGFSSLYYRAIGDAPALEIIAHRAIWSLLFTLILVAATGQIRIFARLFSDRRMLLTLLISSILVSVNWLGFIWAVNNGKALEASMGYFIMPIVMVVLGRIFLDERLSRNQLISLALVCLGVLNLLIAIQQLPWIALLLAISFGFYSLVRKKINVSALVGLTMECLFLAPIALIYLWLLHRNGTLVFGTLTIGFDLLLLGSGLMTALPLILFTSASKRLRLSTVGLLQYLNPTVQFLLAVFLFNEPFSIPHLITFSLIWIGLIVFSVDSRSQLKRASAARRLAETPP
ncbi:MAG: EamA family transporter RarD [Sedimenticola sp.]|uniref:EamA family transporter RarD n=1 Tax=Sedimenticola thiotaurini TaxID=1543721 RepID=A0A558CRS8_9GAMM|nr:EamA family transporter RarD [Sedimenticola sp.]TVT51475.1 MAG: EamA family transporter RarD [Sedimenticola thiotaurini]